MTQRILKLTDQGQAQFFEERAGGTNKVSIQAPSTLASDYSLTLPTAPPGSQQFLRSDASGNLDFATSTSSLDDAYNGGTTITADAGAVAISASTNNALLTATQSGAVASDVVQIANSHASATGAALAVTAGHSEFQNVHHAGPVPWFNVMHSDHGATGDGTTDDTAAIQAAIDAAEAEGGGCVFFPRPSSFYRITTELTVTAPVKLYSLSNAEIRQEGAGANGFNVTGDGVVFDYLKIVGPGVSTGVGGSGILFDGGSAGSEILEERVVNCQITDFDGWAVRAEHVDGLVVNDNVMSDHYYAGVLMYSVFNFVIHGNKIENLTGTGNSQYGVAASRDGSGTTATFPRCRDGVISHNRVYNSAHKGIDSHAGQRISIVGNEIRGCDQGIGVVPSQDDGVDDVYAPLQISIIGNNIDSEDGTGGADNGIKLSGAPGASLGTPDEYATGCIVGNTVRRHGDQTNTVSGSGGIVIDTTMGAVVTGNYLDQPSPYGVLLIGDNKNHVVTGNAVIDVFSSTASVANAYEVRSDYNVGYIGENYAGVASKSATEVLYIGVRITDLSNNSIRLGINSAPDASLAEVNDSGAHGSMRLDAGTVVLTGDLQFQGGEKLSDVLTGSKTYDPPSIADGDQDSTSLTVTGAALGDFVMVSASVDLQGLSLTGYVGSADTVWVVYQNQGGSPVNLASHTVRVWVFQRGT